MAAYITVGAKTSHGGTVITGSPHTTHNGIPVSRKGDKVICKKCKKVTTILTGDPSFIVDGAPIARGGDVTSCGAKLIASQQSFAESGFEVFGVEQAAALVFGKSEPDALFSSLTASDNKSISVDNYDENGNYLGNYRLTDETSNLSASIASPMPIPFPGALSVPRVPAGIRPYPFTNTYDLQNPKNPFGKNCQDLLKKISNLRENIAKRERELIEDKNNLPERGENLRNWATKRGHRALIRIQENNLRKREQEYDKDCQLLA